MKLTVTQENLSKALATVGKVAGGKVSLPVLNNVLLRTDSNRLLIAATNLEIAITQYIGANVQSNGAITIPARLMTEYVTNLPKGNVTLELDGTKLHINADNFHSTINGMAADEFPELPAISDAQSLTLGAAELKHAITQTVFVASRDDTRPVLTGVYCHSHDGGLYLAATDGYRLAERRVADIVEDISAIIPSSTMQDAVRVLPEDCKEIEVMLDSSQVRFLMGNVEITSRLIDGTFPDYRQLIPKETDISFSAPKDDFLRIVKVASLFARESGGSITIKTDVAVGNVSIHSLASQLGENTSEVATKPTADGSVSLNSRYVVDAMGAIDGSSITIGFSGKLAPFVIRSDEDDTYQHIIMPLKS
jgi:DNA polymerase III subunit beta